MVHTTCTCTGHLIGCDKKSEIVRYFQGRLYDKIGLLCHKLCNFFQGNLNCFTRSQKRKTTLMLFNGQFECKGIIKHLFYNKIVKLSDYFDPEKKKDTCLTLHNVRTPLTTLLVSEIKMAAQIPRSKVSDVLQGFLAFL